MAMTAPKSPRFLQIVVVVAIVSILLIAVVRCTPSPPPGPRTGDPQQGSSQRAEADVPAETMRSLANRMTENELQTQRSGRETSETLSKINSIEARLGTLINSARPGAGTAAQTPDQARAANIELEELRRENAALKRERASGGSVRVGGATTGGQDIPPGLGYDDGPSVRLPKVPINDLIGAVRSKAGQAVTSGSTSSSERLVSIAPLNAPSALDAAGKAVNGAVSVRPPRMSVRDPRQGSVDLKDRSADELPVAVYTIPANSTLLGSVSMTALIGRVPTSGSVQDPYPFKVVTGADNLATNGIYIPGLQGMVWQGTAVGDWGLSCVRGTLDSVTYTFKDGTVQTHDLRSAQRSSDQRNAQSGSAPTRALAWISDSRGICIPGDRISNAAPVLTARVAASGFEAAAKAYAQSETTTLFNGVSGGATQLLTGDALKYGGYSALAGGASDVKRWLDERLGQIFDAVYAPPGQEIAIHINTEIQIDYDPLGRKVNHASRHAQRARLD